MPQRTSQAANDAALRAAAVKGKELGASQYHMNVVQQHPKPLNPEVDCYSSQVTLTLLTLLSSPLLYSPYYQALTHSATTNSGPEGLRPAELQVCAGQAPLMPQRHILR